ncbi:MAG: hypothetical protein PHU80_01475 [Kiritimatiellae bacterium]|nr:hypothetical protein [Kiritimatiellia bacterium]
MLVHVSQGLAEEGQGRIAVLREPAVARRDGHADPEHLARLLQDAGLRTFFIRAADLGDEASFSHAKVDLVVLPNAPFFPQQAMANFKKYLKAGGAFFSIGGYAFDELCVPAANGWDVWANGLKDRNARLNTRYGEHGDTMRLHPEQIGVFDPSFLLRDVAHILPSAGQFVAAGAWRHDAAGLQGPAAVAMTGSNNPVFPEVYARWIPLLESIDRLGRPRGPVAALVLNYAGPYAGANWGFCGVTDRNLFSGAYPEVEVMFTAACRKLLGGPYLRTVKSDMACYRPGEEARIRAAVYGVSGPSAKLAVRFRVNGKLAAEVPLADGMAECLFKVEPGTPDFLEFSGELVEQEVVSDVMRGGFAVFNPAAAEIGPRVEWRGNYFDFNGRPLFFGGVNTSGMMFYSDNENPLVWRRDLARMGDYAINTLRLLHFSPFSDDDGTKSRGSSMNLKNRPEKLRRQADAIVQLAQTNQVSVFLSLHDWLPLDISDEELAMQQDWNRFWVQRYAGVPGMLYDIQNEPGTALRNYEVLRPLYERWLRDRYGSVNTAYKLWSDSGGKPGIDFNAKAAGWRDLRVRDNERFRAWLYARWQNENAAGVRAGAPHAAVTVGHLQNHTSSEKVLDTAGIDFVNIHHYGEVSHLRGILKLIDRRFEGKGFSLGEFGSKIAHTARNKGDWGDPHEASVSHYLAVGHYALGMGAAFVANWSWKDFRDCVFPWGVTHADLTPKPVLLAYRNMMLLFRTAQPRYEAPRLYLVLPDSFRLGPDSERIHGALHRATDWLLSANVPFGVINEESLERLPPEARALVWPLAICPSDKAFDLAANFAAKGGHLYLSGDPRFDEHRRPERRDRLERLGHKALVPEPQSPFSGTELPQDLMFRLSPDGRVAWMPEPLELLDNLFGPGRAIYRRFIDEVSVVPRVRLAQEDSDIHIFDVALRNGSALVGVNMSKAKRRVVVLSHNGYPEIVVDIAAGRTLYVQLGLDGRVVAAAAQGRLAVNGNDILAEGCGDMAFLALDGRDLRESGQVAAMPFGPGRFALARAAGSVPLAGAVGEFRDGRWVTLEEQRLETGGGAVAGAVDSATAYDLRVLHGGAGDACAEFEKLLYVRQ